MEQKAGPASGRIRAVIFDVDGTLVDSVDAHARAWEDTFRQFGYEFPYQELRHNVGKGADQYLAAFVPPEVALERGPEMVAWRLKRFKKQYLPAVKPFPCVRELFQRIREDGKRIALASSAKQDELESYLRLVNIGDLIDAKTTADDAEKSKPHPDIFEAALAKLGVAPTEAVAAGDTPYDGEASLAAGMAIVGLLCGGFPEDELRRAGCGEIYRDPADLLAHYEGSLLAT